jgi:hypothetical protein
MKKMSLYPPHWVIATLAIVVIFTAMYVLRVDGPTFTPGTQLLQNAD